jgi:hypothetical protein
LHGSALVFGLLWLAKGHNNWNWNTFLGLRTSSTSLLRKSST